MCLVLMCIAFFFLLMSRQPISTRPDTLFPSPTCVRAQLRQSRKAVTARIEARSVARATAEVVEADEPALVALGGVVRVDQQLDEIGIDRFVLAPRFAFARGGRGSVGVGNALPRLAERRDVDEAGAGLFEPLWGLALPDAVHGQTVLPDA